MAESPRDDRARDDRARDDRDRDDRARDDRARDDRARDDRARDDRARDDRARGDRGPPLLALARRSLGAAFAGREEAPLALPEVARSPWLAEPGACFVTLRVAGELRGCLGTVTARQALALDVWSNARGAAFRDPRFAPLTAEELPGAQIEVSLLSPLTPIEPPPDSFGSAAAAVRPGVDGLLLEAGGRRGIFLPQVWESLPRPRRFLAALLRKAGLPEERWPEDARLQRFVVSKYCEAEAEAERSENDRR